MPLPLSQGEDATKRRLQKLIKQKKEQLTKLITKTELLKVELDMAKQEYDVRVGNLYLKDNQLDLEIIYLRNVIQLMDSGLSYKAAVEQLNDTYYAKQREYEFEREQMREGEKIFKQREEIKSKEVINEIRKIWKKLVAIFHPDLVQDKETKKQYEEMMKQINQAYEEHNLKKLKQLEKQARPIYDDQNTVEDLENILEDIENQLREQNILHQELRNSEWFGWRTRIKRAKNEGYDLFAGMERALLNDIVRKMEILKILKKKVPNLSSE